MIPKTTLPLMAKIAPMLPMPPMLLSIVVSLRL